MKTRLTNGIRDVIAKWMIEQFDAKQTGTAEALPDAVTAYNDIVRARYPAKDMAVLRKYEQALIQYKPRFSQGGRVFGVDFSGEPESLFARVPAGKHYGNSGDIFPVSAEDAAALERYSMAKDAAFHARVDKQREYAGFLNACRSVEDVQEVVNLPVQLLERLKINTQLVAVNPQIIESIRADFKAAA